MCRLSGSSKWRANQQNMLPDPITEVKNKQFQFTAAQENTEYYMKV